ncbi:protein phosphatase 1 regulatory subunit 35 isoform X2 [Amphiprion ocellaris]|uniref:Protein phosphatase 1 regulatory subunit 35 C-terminal domain-containing protein n=1 Tax=Amphiprion ocellaris TaxID=80972 RepID=A0A3Q1B772_AMPOC|nr:protein phosphatase 1 regulatory subunit 35 isoform X2 [Amphiprion ocellaris]
MSFFTLHSSSPSPQPAPLPLSPSSLTCCPDLDLSVALSPTSKTGHAQLKPLQQSQQTDQIHAKPHCQGQTTRQRNMQVCFEDPVVVTVTPEPRVTLTRHTPIQQAVRVLGGALRQLVEPQVSTSSEEPGCLERAELNTTLTLKAEIQSLQGAEFNSQKAIQETLQSSERTKNLIRARATEVVNVSHSQLLFTSLVSIDVQEDQLMSQVLHEKLLLAPRHCYYESKVAKGPSLLFFITSDLLRQKPLPLEEEPVNGSPCPSSHPADSTFDLYRRQRCWETTP